MTPAQIADAVKRMARFGSPGNNADQAALDILTWLNFRRYEVWRAHDWEWSLDAISLSVGPSSYEKTFPATAGEIDSLGIQGTSDVVVRYSRRQYLKWQKRPNASDAGDLVGYIPIGRDSSGNLRVRFFAAPSETKTVEGWAKKRISKLTTSDWSTDLVYFPEEMQDVLFKFVLADAYKQNNDLRADQELRGAYASLRTLKGEELSEADLDPQSPLPDYMIHKARRRGAGTTVV